MRIITPKNLLALSLLGAVVATAASPEPFKFFRNLTSNHLELRSSAYAGALTYRDEQKSELLEYVASGPGPEPLLDTDTWVRAVSLVGHYRVAEAVEPLVKNLMVLPVRTERYMSFGGTPPVQFSYPCANALVHIGEPSKMTPLLIDVITSTKQKEERELASWVLLQVKGKVEATARLRAEVSTSVSPQNKADLNAAIKYIETYKPTYGVLFRRMDGTLERSTPFRR